MWVQFTGTYEHIFLSLSKVHNGPIESEGDLLCFYDSYWIFFLNCITVKETVIQVFTAYLCSGIFKLEIVKIVYLDKKLLLDPSINFY